MVTAAVVITTEINPPMRPYSMTVTPDSFSAKRARRALIIAIPGLRAAKCDPANRSHIERGGGRGKIGARSFVEVCIPYIAAHQKLSRRIKNCRGILRGKAVDFSGENVASEL
jgi:hypothetical protein